MLGVDKHTPAGYYGDMDGEEHGNDSNERYGDTAVDRETVELNLANELYTPENIAKMFLTGEPPARSG